MFQTSVIGPAPSSACVSAQRQTANWSRCSTITSINGRCSTTHHEDCGEATPFHYSVPNLRVTFGRAKRNIGATSRHARPGRRARPVRDRVGDERTGRINSRSIQSNFAIINEPKIDEGLGLPFSSRHLLECFELGAEKFGWSKRTPDVGSMKRDGLTLGWGMAGCAWIAARFPAEASVQLRDDGTVRVACATQDIGTGTYTILAQLASHRTGVPLDKVEVALGDTSLPEGPTLGRFDGDSRRWSRPYSRRPTMRSHRC